MTALIILALFLFSVIGLIVIWITPIRGNYKVFKTISALLIATNLYFLYVASILSYLLTVIVSALLLLSVLSLVFRSRKHSFEKANDNGRIRSKRGLGTWVFLSLLVVAIGTGAAVVQFNNPSMQDQYNGRDSSAIATVIATLVAAMFVGIGVRVSYKKYARFDQAALIADAIKTQIQSSGTNTPPVLSKSQDTEERLRKLESLLANGLISQDEYGQKKKEIIDSI